MKPIVVLAALAAIAFKDGRTDYEDCLACQ